MSFDLVMEGYTPFNEANSVCELKNEALTHVYDCFESWLTKGDPARLGHEWISKAEALAEVCNLIFHAGIDGNNTRFQRLARRFYDSARDAANFALARG